MIGRHQDIGGDDRLAQFRDPVLRRQFGRVVDVDHGAVRQQHLVDDRRRAGDQVEVVFALEPLLHDIHVQQPQETAAKPEAERSGHFGFEMQRRVVQFQLLERVAKLLVVVRTHRKQPREHPRLNLLESGQRLLGRIGLEGDGVAHRRAVDFLDARDDEADLAGEQGIAGHRFRREPPQLVDRVTASGRHDADLGARLQRTIHDPHQRDDADIIVEPRIDDQRLQRRHPDRPWEPECA